MFVDYSLLWYSLYIKKNPLISYKKRRIEIKKGEFSAFQKKCKD